MKTKLTLVERTILANQYRILAAIGDNTSSNSRNAEILENGYTGKYHLALLADEETSEEICKETEDILQMFRVIAHSFSNLSEEDKSSLNMDAISFEGFDNHEPHFHYASFMIDNLNLWKEHKDKYIDSHTSSSINKYRTMLSIYKQRYRSPDYKLTAKTLQEMIDAV